MNNWLMVAALTHLVGGALTVLAYAMYQRTQDSQSFFTGTCYRWLLGLGALASALYTGLSFVGYGLTEAWELTIGGAVSFVFSVLLYFAVCFLAQIAARQEMATIYHR
jgi:hypothetical protein